MPTLSPEAILTTDELTVIGGGLSGCEAAWQAANQGIKTTLYEMRPNNMTGAHETGNLAELVCSNSLGSLLPDRAAGVLKEEMRRLDSLILKCAEQTAIPAGGSLAVDRLMFSELITQKIGSHPNIHIIREEATAIPEGPAIIASGPLTSEKFSQALQTLLGHEGLAFFDAIAPVIKADSIDMEIAFRASRYENVEESEGDYINCPFNKEEYYQFIDALLTAKRIPLKSFEEAIVDGVKGGMHTFFESCLPVEIIAERGKDSLAFGPMRPIGLADPRTNRRPFAVLQLRQDNLAGSLYNMVGFQTNLTFPEQARVFHMIPGLEKAEFARYGQMHRNTFLASPLFLHPTLQCRIAPHLFFAGQITGIEGYMGNAASGLLAGRNAARFIKKQPLLQFPPDTMLGALCRYITGADLKDFQPMKANFGILPEVELTIRGKRNRGKIYSQRAAESFQKYLEENNC